MILLSSRITNQMDAGVDKMKSLIDFHKELEAIVCLPHCYHTLNG